MKAFRPLVNVCMWVGCVEGLCKCRCVFWFERMGGCVGGVENVCLFRELFIFI